ncbi:MULTISPECIES: helix-turn-helix domain-containing protein [Bacillus]|uniref:helix-turn-helix domain-containing protein n=1 Tax=Bacillus TaxID=1386 RepID=UPI0011A7B110|nr:MULTISPECIES: helix-turn-helix domain-containing protein [Bacillus subtilis group]MBR0016337.1 helix-turn-helix domain-containing protein [Bacillus subtilis]MBT2167356.1 helix-turn-helix domain-containing protein [Bacillus subtilis]MDQ1879006.1 helix-turn-helix domain-containing protein [Bacillus subtilis]MED3628961.1 helix-turn-helix domain-containing protein [Bacillus subtilis]USY31681.1 helix-turn-helix domain-containing protein [Bacillus velezensis]
MEFHLRGRQEVEGFVKTEVLSTSEVAEILNVNKQRMSALINTERIIPVKKIGRTSLFLRQDVETLKKELKANQKYRPNK